MTRMTPIFALIWLTIISLPSFAAEVGENPADQVGSWLDENDLVYQNKENGGIALAFKGDIADRIDIHIDFSEEFIHFTTPIDYIPEATDEGFFYKLIKLTSPIPMIKPSIDDDSLFYLAIDLPLTAMTKDEVITDISLLVAFIDINYYDLRPWAEEE